LHDRLARDGAPLLLEVIQKLQTGVATEVPQDESEATQARKLSRDSAQIDWTPPAAPIARQIRAMFSWPGCHVRLIDETGAECSRATLVCARPIDESGSPGTILPSGAVGAGTGAVQIVELQPEGKRPMPLAAFRNGHPWRAGMRVES
jgi:methionyl-tRNA formyltransferase